MNPVNNCINFAVAAQYNSVFMETGALKCANGYSGDECTGQVPYTEKANSAIGYGYHCFSLANWSTGDSDYFSIQRSGTTPTFYSYIAGSSWQGLTNYGTTVRFSAWGENPFDNSCATDHWSALAHFTAWGNEVNGNFVNVTSSSQSPGACWKIGAVSNGAFNVST